MKLTRISYKQRVLAVLLCLCMALPLCACGEARMTQRQVPAMNTVMTMTAYGKKADAGSGHPLAPLLVNRPVKKAERCKDKKKRADCIGPEERDAVFYQRIHQNILHTFVGGSGESAEHSRGQPAQETEAAGDRQGYPAGLK